MFTIKKNLNNNVALVKDREGKDFIIFGNGIAYGKKAADKIPENEVKECYFLGRKDYSYFSEMLETMSPDIIYVAELIVAHAQKEINGTYTTNLLLILADHLNFAIERVKENIVIKSPLEYEIRRLYHKEMEIGKEALEIIKRELGVTLPPEEAPMFALHIVNSQIGGEAIQNAMLITEITNSILNIVNIHFQIILDEKSIEVGRFLIHLRYFIMKYLKNENTIQDPYDDLYQYISSKDKSKVQCVNKIMNYLEKKYGWNISENDQLYLMLHLHRLVNKG